MDSRFVAHGSSRRGAAASPAQGTGFLLLGGERPVPLPLGRVTVGRSRSCDLVIRGAGIRARHATLHVEKASVEVERADAHAEVLVNQLPVARGTVAPGDEICFGANRFALSVAPAAEPAAAEGEVVRRSDDLTELLERLFEWSRTGPLDRRTAMLGLLVERLSLAGAALVRAGAANDLEVLSAGGQVVTLLRADRIAAAMAPGRHERSPPLIRRGDQALTVLAAPDGARLGLLATGISGETESTVLRLALRMFAHEHLRASCTAPMPAPSGELVFPSGMLVGRSAAMRGLYGLLHAVRDNTHPLLLLGETGVGKSVLAGVLHGSSPRARLAMLEVDCGAPSELFSRQLRRQVAKLEAAASVGRVCTLMVDEVGALAPREQEELAAALNTLVDKPAMPLARVIATSNRDLEAAVASGRLRGDLWFRLAGFAIRVPPLRERLEDLPALFEHFLIEAVGAARFTVSLPAMQALVAHRWPGNLRELRSEAHRVASRRRAGMVDVGDLSPALQQSGVRDSEEWPLPATAPLAQGLLAVELRLISDALQRCRGNLSQTARELGISRPRLHRRMAAFGLQALHRGAEDLSHTDTPPKG
jgi:transcriptional regulator with AAA-type ATPase domain